MKKEEVTSGQAIENARNSLRMGDRMSARRWAEKAAALDPNLEDAWLLLASLASLRASIAYFERAIKINPESEEARKGLHSAITRLRKNPVIQPQGNDTLRDPERPVYEEPITQPNKTISTGMKPLEPSQSPGSFVIKSPAKYKWSFFSLFTIFFCTAIIWAFWPGSTGKVLAFINVPTNTLSIPGALSNVLKPTYTSTSTPTFTPTATFTPSPTPTDTSTPTETSTPTNTPLPTNTYIPAATKPVDQNPGDAGIKWIDVDLSEQMLYAYEGNVIVASFLVSTGVPAYPTVTGQFHIYVKYVSTLMAGDGYYLPNVPYTMYFYKGYGIHGTYWHHNFGHPMSHGCVNMYTPDAEWMFYWAPLGTLVNVHY